MIDENNNTDNVADNNTSDNTASVENMDTADAVSFSGGNVSIDEIEIEGASFSFKCFSLKIEDMAKAFEMLGQNCTLFDPYSDVPGFFQCDCNGGLIRGSYGMMYKWEPEQWIDGISTKVMLKRIESCNFMITPLRVYVWGKSGPSKLLADALSGALAERVGKVEFDQPIMEQVRTRLGTIKAIVIENQKNNPLRRARLSGEMEEYESYGVCVAHEYEINSVAGIAETPLGAIKLTVDKKGTIRLGVKKGLVVNVDNLDWIMDYITADVAPEIRTLIGGASENPPF